MRRTTRFKGTVAFSRQLNSAGSKGKENCTSLLWGLNPDRRMAKQQRPAAVLSSPFSMTLKNTKGCLKFSCAVLLVVIGRIA